MLSIQYERYHFTFVVATTLMNNKTHELQHKQTVNGYEIFHRLHWFGNLLNDSMN